MIRKQDNELEDLVGRPEWWMAKAAALRAAAAAVWYCQRSTPSGDLWRSLECASTTFGSDTWKVYQMLCGMSLELAYKASLVALGSELRATHDLVALAEAAMVSVSDKQRQLLALLSECVVWEGRYPYPKAADALERAAFLKYETLYRAVWNGRGGHLEPIEPDPLDWDGYGRLWDAAVAAYEWHRS